MSNQRENEEKSRIVLINSLLANIFEVGHEIMSNNQIVNYFNHPRFEQYKQWVETQKPLDDYTRAPLMFEYLNTVDRTAIIWKNKTEFAEIRGFTVDGYSFSEIDKPETYPHFMYKVILYSFV